MAIEKIDDYVKQKIEGKLHFEDGKKDILTNALDSYEHAGRVRGVGGHITPTIYFNVGRIRKSHLVDDNLILLQKKELIEAKMLISEQDARIAEQNARISDQDERIQRLESMFKKGACDFEIDEKGSCSVKLHPNSEDTIKAKKGVPNYETFNDDGLQVLSSDDFFQGKLVALTLDSKTNIVAYGTIVNVNAAGKLLHGVPLPMDCMRVSIDKAVDTLAHLPFSIPNECDTVGDAIGTHVAWPAHLVVMQDEKPQRKKSVDRRNNPTMSSNVPRSLHLLYCHCKHALDDETNISMIFDHDLFDEDYELLVHLEDIIPFYHLEPISANCIVVYMCYHWILTVIDPYKEAVYLLDSLSHRNRDADWKYVVDMSLRMFNSNKQRKGKKQATWEVVKGPRQPDAKQCGFYVMKFMREIIEENATSEKDSLSSISTLRKKLMKCVQSGRNAYKIVFMNSCMSTSAMNVDGLYQKAIEPLQMNLAILWKVFLFYYLMECIHASLGNRFFAANVCWEWKDYRCSPILIYGSLSMFIGLFRWSKFLAHCTRYHVVNCATLFNYCKRHF